MIIYHQDNVSAFAGNHTYYWPTQPLFFQRVSATSAVVDQLIAQARATFRFVFSRVFGRVN